MDKFEKSIEENNGYFVNGKVTYVYNLLYIFTISSKKLNRIYMLRPEVQLKSKINFHKY